MGFSSKSFDLPHPILLHIASKVKRIVLWCMVVGDMVKPWVEINKLENPLKKTTCQAHPSTYHEPSNL